MIRRAACLLLLASAAGAADDPPDAKAAHDYALLEQSYSPLATLAHEAGVAMKFRQDITVRWMDMLVKKPLEHCAKPYPAGQDGDQRRQWLIAHPDVEQCMLGYTDQITAALDNVIAEAKVGKVSDATLKRAVAIADLPVPAPEAASAPAGPPVLMRQASANKPAVSEPVNPWGGTGARIEHTANGAFVSYTDSGGTAHRYPVMRPTFAPASMFKDDTGGWIYVAPDRKSGMTFQVGAGGSVSGTPLNALQIPMMVGK